MVLIYSFFLCLAGRFKFPLMFYQDVFNFFPKPFTQRVFILIFKMLITL